MCDDDILNGKENIIMQQDLYNMDNKEKYQLILGNYFVSLLINNFL